METAEHLIKDQTLRPWTLNEPFDDHIKEECYELDKASRRTAPFKNAGDDGQSMCLHIYLSVFYVSVFTSIYLFTLRLIIYFCVYSDIWWHELEAPSTLVTLRS